MSFADPQSVTISGSAISLPRVSTGNGISEYLSADQRVRLTAASQYNKRTRRTLRLDHSKIAADPYSAEQAEYAMSVYLVFDTPNRGIGYSAADALAVYAGLKGQMTASSDALITKLLAGES
jgi:hypothetical protein